MRNLITFCVASCFAASARFAAADTPPVKLIVKPLLCVIDKGAENCLMTFDIRWKSVLPAEYCLKDGIQLTPLRCWPSARDGELKQQRQVHEDFAYSLTAPAGTEQLAEVKISVLRVGSEDRRRERRTRHVWDVL